MPDATSSLVAHVVVVGFHAALGNRIEFAYPRLRGETFLRSPKLSDTSDICDPNPGSPAHHLSPAALSQSPSHTPSHTPPQAQPHRSSLHTPPPHQTSLAAFRSLSGGIGSASTPPPRPDAPWPDSGVIASARKAQTTPERSEFDAKKFSAAVESIRVSVSPARPPAPPGAPHPQASAGDWGTLPPDWAHLPFMAIPDGAHDLSDDFVFFTLPPDVHCVSCFRQVDAIDAVTHSASRSTRAIEINTAARGSVQKSVVLLCRRPLFGFLAARLRPAVRRYFEQADFARTDALANLFHELNMSLAHPQLRLTSTLFHGISLAGLLRTLGPQALAVVKLILLEKRIVFYSHPVAQASQAVVAFASFLPGALDSIAPSMKPIDATDRDADYGLPLALFRVNDRVRFQPYAPLPVVSDILQDYGHPLGCVVGTSFNVGMLLATTAAAASKKAAAAAVADAKKPKSSSSSAASTSSASKKPPALPRLSHSSSEIIMPHAPPQTRLSTAASTSCLPTAASALSSSDDCGSTSEFASSSPSSNAKRPRRLPVVDALVNLNTGKVSVASAIEPLCRISRQERRLMKDLLVAASSSVSARAPVDVPRDSVCSDYTLSSNDYIRDRMRTYLLAMLSSVANVPGVLPGPRGGETWSAEMVRQMDLSSLSEYNTHFIRAWLQSRNAAVWARRCDPCVATPVRVPRPELDESLMEDPLLPVERVAAGLTGIRDNVAIGASKAADGISSLFSRLEVQLTRLSGNERVGERVSGESEERLLASAEEEAEEIAKRG